MAIPPRKLNNPPLPDSGPYSGALDSANSQVYDYGFKRILAFPLSQPVGAGILACTFFLFIAFLSNPLLVNITSLTLGIVVTISTFVLLLLIVLILFLL